MAAQFAVGTDWPFVAAEGCVHERDSLLATAHKPAGGTGLPSWVARGYAQRERNHYHQNQGQRHSLVQIQQEEWLPNAQREEQELEQVGQALAPSRFVDEDRAGEAAEVG